VRGGIGKIVQAQEVVQFPALDRAIKGAPMIRQITLRQRCTANCSIQRVGDGGGWAELIVPMNAGKDTLYFGAGTDDPKNSNLLPGPGGATRAKNSFLWASYFRKITNEVTLAAYEAAYLSTREGMTQNDFGGMVQAAHSQQGFEGGASIQVGENSALPHGSAKPHTAYRNFTPSKSRRRGWLQIPAAMPPA